MGGNICNIKGVGTLGVNSLFFVVWVGFLFVSFAVEGEVFQRPLANGGLIEYSVFAVAADDCGVA